MPIVFKEPKVKRIAYLRRARQPINTFTNFFDSVPKLGKKEKKKIKEPVIIVHEEKPIEARAQQPNSRWNTGKDIRSKVKSTVKIEGKKKKVIVKRVNIPGRSEKKEESLENYKKRLNINFINKKHYGRFTQNPRQTGRELEPVSNELTNTKTSTTTHVIFKKIGNMP